MRELRERVSKVVVRAIQTVLLAIVQERYDASPRSIALRGEVRYELQDRDHTHSVICSPEAGLYTIIVSIDKHTTLCVVLLARIPPVPFFIILTNLELGFLI